MQPKEPSRPNPAANDEVDALTRLKALLIGPEQQSIERLDAEAHDRATQARRVADNLPESLDHAYRSTPKALTRALDQPVATCLKGSVQRDPGFFADILYPVMGPAIRRSISQTLKALVQEINQALEHSFTLKGLRWRLESARSGVPFAEIVLRHTLRYRVDEMFLIETGSGLLIKHLTQGPETARDPDAVSGMLTAIRDFAGDTFDDAAGVRTRLETVDIGEHTLWLVHGPRAYLACAIRGTPPIGLRDELAQVVDEIHRKHDDVLAGYADDSALADRLQPLLEHCLQSEKTSAERRGFPWPVAIFGLLTVAGLTWWLHSTWRIADQENAARAQLQAAVAQLDASPGTVITDWRIAEGRLAIKGLHDPMTRAPTEVLTAAGLDPSSYSATFQPFESSQPAAALARARARLVPPDDVTLTLSADGSLKAIGAADSAWIGRATLLAVTVPGINAFDRTELESHDARLAHEVAAWLNPPPSAKIGVNDAVATITGVAPFAWIEQLADLGTPPRGLAELRFEDLQPVEARRLDALRHQIEQTWISFQADIELSPNQQSVVESLADRATELRRHAQTLGWPIQLRIIGRTDGTGTLEQNLFLARERAATVASALRATQLDLPDLLLGAINQPPQPPGIRPDLTLRRVEFRVLTGSQPVGNETAKP